MKAPYTFIRKHAVLLMFFSFMGFQYVQAGEFVIMNRLISWDVNSGSAFWTIPTTNYAWPDDWLSPDDYYHGQVYTRYEVVSVATSAPFGMQFGFFMYNPDRNHRDSVGELCENVRPLAGVGSVAINNSSPSTWWKSHGGVDFSRPIDFQSLSAIIYAANPPYPVSPAGSGGDDAGLAWSQRFSWFPVTLRVTVVAVSNGATFSGWNNYIPNAITQKPTPTYGIDCINETTDKVVATTDEYSEYPTMYGAVSGTGQKITLTPGRPKYFRTKAANGLRASEVQVLTVPIRPATPKFALDLVNHRTTTYVTSDYEYCDFADMADAASGSNAYVSIPAGTAKFFCLKATSTTFKSNVQSLSESSKAAIPHELVIFNGYADYPNNTDTNGFYYFWYNADMPVNWITPENYYGGEVYMRYELLSEKTTTPIGLQFGIWQMTPPETGQLHETMSAIKTLNGPGTVVTASGSLSLNADFWRLDPNLDFTRMNLTWHFGILPWKVNPSDQQIRQENPSVWAERNTTWFPMRAYVTVVAVASGYNFSGWNNYLGVKPSIPNYTIDYVAEKTSQVIATTDEYSLSPTMSPVYDGTGAQLALQPGQTVYLRTKAEGNNPASDIERLIVPSRPAAPTVTIDFTNATTAQTITSDIEYASSAAFTSASAGNGSKIALTPGQDLYFRQKGNSTSFVGNPLHLIVPGKIMLGHSGSDTITDNKFSVYAVLNNVTPALSLSNVQVINGTAQNLANGNVFDVYPIAKGPVLVSIPVNAIGGASFASNQLNIYYDKIPTGVTDIQGSDFRIYPNPSKDRTITIQTKLNVPYKLGVYNVDGTFIKSIDMNSSEFQQIALPELPRGMYFLRFDSSKGNSVQKLVLE